MKSLDRCASLSIASVLAPHARGATWPDYGGNAQHTAQSAVPSMPLDAIRWHTPVDLAPQYTNGKLFIHYGSPTVTDANTVIIPVKTGATNGFRIDARNGATGSLK